MTMRTGLSLAAGFGLMLAAATAPAADGRPIDERRPLKADAKVSVSNVAGSIEVEAWDRNELHLTGTLAPEVEELAIEGGPASLDIEVKLPKHSRRTGDTVLKLKVPVGTSLHAEAVSADVTMRGIKGTVQVASVSGDVRLEVGSAKVEAKSVSGDVLLQAPATSVRAETVSGDVVVRGSKGEIHSESVSGGIVVQATDVRRLDAESVSGDIRLDLQLAAEADVSVETLSGELELTLPALPDFKVELETFSGDLESAFGDITAGTSDEEGRHYHRKGSGRGRLQLQSFSGDIVLKKR